MNKEKITMPVFDKNRKLVESPHVVILGAGASIAMSQENKEKFGKKLPTMNDLVDIVELSDLLDANDIDHKNKNFEELFSDLKLNQKYDKITDLIEKKIYNYFQNMKISDDVTIYDKLVMSLTKHDVIASFNWDPFLLQALTRCSGFTHNLPRTINLHGNVGTGICCNCFVEGIIGNRCSRCDKVFEPTQLLYPIKEKDYFADELIWVSWSDLQNYLYNAYYITIFGYSAPISDIEAKQLLLIPWQDNRKMEIGQFDIIDVDSKDKIEKTWEKFVHNNHGTIYQNVNDTWLFRYPRRTTTVLWEKMMMLRHNRKEMPFEDFRSIQELYEFVKPLIDEENNNAN